jgi:hypothetical protein
MTRSSQACVSAGKGGSAGAILALIMFLLE